MGFHFDIELLGKLLGFGKVLDLVEVHTGLLLDGIRHRDDLERLGDINIVS